MLLKNMEHNQMNHKQKISLYELYAKEIYEMVKKEVPIHRNKFSPKRYTNWQLLSAVIYGKTQEMTYRQIVDHLLISDTLRSILEFQEVPSHKTLWESFDMASEDVFKMLFEQSIELFNTLKKDTYYPKKQD